MRRPLIALFLATFALGCQPREYGVLTPGPRGIVETPVADYPFGDAVDVYRAALDLLYTNGTSRPAVIVMRDSAILRYGGPCTKCPRFTTHKSRIDTSTIEGFATLPPVKPRIRKFDYDVPIRFMTNAELASMWTAAQVYDSIHAHEHTLRPGGFQHGYEIEFLRRYPGAWGLVDLSLVGFNNAHTEALLEVRQFCGVGCYSYEVVFFRKVVGKWRPVERIPREAVYDRTALRYLGPAGDNPAQSELLVDADGAPLRSYSMDRSGVYRAVLDSLYSFHGERPRTVVISARHVWAPRGFYPNEHPIDSSTRAAFGFQSAIQDPMNAKFSVSTPTAIITDDSLRALDAEGAPLQREAVRTGANEETAGLWLAFHKHYPGAWGYVELSRIGYNPAHTQALVYAAHQCGSSCGSGDVWLLLRDAETWTVAGRTEIAEISAAGWALDSLRYLGKAADPAWYRPRRAHGILTSFETGAILPSFEVTFYGGSYRTTVRTDAAGAYQADNLPINRDLFFKVACPIAGRADSVAGPYIMTRPGLDTTVNLGVQFRGCTHLDRTHPLIAGMKPSGTPQYANPIPPDLAGVYRVVLDALYPASTPSRAPILIQPAPVRSCAHCIESEAPRLIRKGLMDPSIERNFASSTDTAFNRPFAYRRQVDTLPMWDRYWLAQSGKVEWDAMKDAYPGVNAAVSFLRVGFNDKRTEALVEAYIDSAGASEEPETMLLGKRGADWKVTVRDVGREATSAEWSGGKCEPTDAPAHLPARAELERLAGEFSVVRVGAARVFRGRTDTLRLRVEPLKPSRKPGELVSKAMLFDAKGEPQDKVAVTFELTRDTATFTFLTRLPPGMVQLDGWMEKYRILRTTRDGFFGVWSTSNGPTLPLPGYFCAVRR